MIKEFKIEKGIPIPVKIRKPNRKYPFLEMEVDDSFLFSEITDSPSLNRKRRVNANSLCIRYNETEKGKWFEMRETKEGVRVWRLK